MVQRHYHQFDQGTIEVKVGQSFEVTGRFPSITNQRKVTFPEDAFRLVSEREAPLRPAEEHSRNENRFPFGALPPVGSNTPLIYTLEALTEGTFQVEYLYFAAPQTLHNADKYTVKVSR